MSELLFNDSFVAIDFETANSFRGSPCQVGFAIVKNGRITEVGSELCRPPASEGPDDFDYFNTSIHGISWDDVEDKPFFSEVWANIQSRITGLPMVAHNAGFDFSVLRQSLAVDEITSPEFEYACTLVCSRRLLSLPSYGLPYVADELGVDLVGHHDAGADALACAQIAIELSRRHGVATLDELLALAKVRWGKVREGEWSGSVARQIRAQLPTPSMDASPDHFLFGKHICLTGSLPGGIVRNVAFERIAHYGGIPQDGVNKQTELLVVGDLDPETLVLGSELTGKMKKAFQLREKGQAIEVISGFDFMSYLD